MALVKFVAGTAAQFQDLSPKDANTLYFITDERRIYKGDIPYSGGIYQTVAAFPEPDSAAVNTLYVNTATGEVAYFNGTNMQTVVPATGKSISGTGDDTHLATTKAVVDYVTTQLADLDVSALEGRVDTLETEMDAAQASIQLLLVMVKALLPKPKQTLLLLLRPTPIKRLLRKPIFSTLTQLQT